MKRMARAFRKYVITGLLVLLPLAVTLYLLWLLFSITDTLLGSLTELILGRRIPGAGAVLTIVVIVGVGMFAANVIGRRIIQVFEGLFTRIPLVRSIYIAVKQLIDAFTIQNRPGFKQVVLVPFPSTDIYSVGFLTNDDPRFLAGRLGQDVVTVFVPTVPNPTTGFFLTVPRHDVKPLDISMEEGFKLMMSAGAISPDHPGVWPDPTSPTDLSTSGS